MMSPASGLAAMMLMKLLALGLRPDFCCVSNKTGVFGDRAHGAYYGYTRSAWRFPVRPAPYSSVKGLSLLHRHRGTAMHRS